MPTGPRGLLPFGAHFVEQSEAAAAADLALIAMWGFSAAAPFLNGPEELYSQKNEVVGRLFGSDLSSYLLSICEISKSAKRKRPKLASGKSSEISRFEKLQKIKTEHCLVDEREPCGVCPACLFPFLDEKCYRKQLASKLNYKVEKVAANILNSAPPGTSKDFNNLNGSSPQEESRGDAIRGDDGISTAVTWLVEETNNKKLQEKEHQSLEWIDHPKSRLGEARKRHADWVVAELRTRQSQADNEDAQSLSTFIDMLRASGMPTALAKAPDPTDILSPPEHKEIFDHALMCTLLDADVSLVDEDDERFAAPLGESAIPPCMLCRGWHPKRNGYLECPVMRIAYATQSNTLESCENSRRSLPEFVWTPAFISTPWVSSVAPETLYLMECLKELGNAAATDFDRPDVAGKLGPHALLALGLLGEELASAQLRMG
jgi:hypothetical protein